MQYLQYRCQAPYVDVITALGPNRILAVLDDHAAVQSILERIDISVAKHKSQVIAIVGHFDCAGNPEAGER